MLEQGPDFWGWFNKTQFSYHCVHPIHAKMFSIQMLLHFCQIVPRVCTSVLFISIIMYLFYISIYSTPRRSLCVRPDAGRVWTIFPPTHCTHEYLASVRHRALASASASVLLRLRPCVCFCVHASACPSTCLRVRPCFCVSVRPSVCPSVRLQVGPCGPCVCGLGTNISIYVTVHAIGKIDFEI